MNSDVNGHLPAFPRGSAAPSARRDLADRLALHGIYFLRRPLAYFFIVPHLLSTAWSAETVISTASQVVAPQVRDFSFPTSLGCEHLSCAFVSVIPSCSAINGTLLHWCGRSHDRRVTARSSTGVEPTRFGSLISRFVRPACVTPIFILLISSSNIMLFLLNRAHSSSIS